MATIKVLRYHYKILQDGSSPIMIRISKGQGKSKYFSLGLSASEKQFDNENGYFIRDKRLNPSIKAEDENGKKVELDGYETKNAFIDRKKIRAKEIIDEFDRNNIDWTFNMFEEKFINDNKKKSFVLEYIQSIIERFNREGNHGNAKVYSDLLLLLNLFQKDTKTKIGKMQFQDFSYDVVNKFYLYLKNDRKILPNSMSYYLRTLRSVMNYAIKDGCGSKEAYCFSNKYTDTKKIFKIEQLREETKKRYIPQEYLRIIKNTFFDRPPLEYAKRLFLLSFYSYGCSYIDLAKLKKTDIEHTITKDGKQVSVIRYKRSKTHKGYTVQIRPEIQEQLDWFRNNYPIVGDYLLPCVTVNHTGEKLHKHIVNRRKRYNGYLKEIGEELNFPEAFAKISTYYARHSYAMAMRSSGKSIEIIQEALGHDSLKTTKVYLDSFDSELLANESDGLI